MEKELEQLGSLRSKADAIQAKLTKSISIKRDENPAYYDSFSKRIKDTLQEYKANKKSLLDEIANLKALMKEKKAEEPPKTVEKINKKELRRLTDVLKDESVSNVEKNKVARTIFKEIVKGGDDGKTIKCVFWK